MDKKERTEREMGVKRYQKGIKKRREERLRLIRKRQRELRNFSPWTEARPYGPPSYTLESKRFSPLLFKTVCALVLLTGVLLVLKGEHPLLDDGKTWIRQVMSQNFQWDEVQVFFEKMAGTEIGFLPRIFDRNGASKPDNQYVVPVSNARVISEFSPNRQAIVLETGSTLPVEVVKEGWVTFVGEREGFGRTVIINHGQGEESWYGRLDEINVQLYDWVDQGQVIGTTSVPEGQEKGILYFALRRDSVFINPLDVISFD